MPQQRLSDIATRNQVYLEGYKAGEVTQFDKFLKVMAQDVQSILSRDDITDFTRSKFEQMLNQIGVIMNKSLSDYEVVWKQMIDDISLYQAGFEQRALSNVVAGVNFSMPSDAQIMASVYATPIGNIAGANGGALLADYFTSMKSDEVKRVQGAIRLGYAEGQTNEQIIKRVRGSKADGYTDGIWNTTRRNVENVVRTSVQHAASYARESVWQENKSVIKGVKWVSTLDSRTSDQCRALDGQEFPTDKGPRPPAHLNCVLGDTFITTSSDISHVYKRAYKGIMVNIKTASGRSITITPNHPVLTNTGWKAAGQLNCFDQLACISDTRLIENYKENRINAKVCDIFSAMDVAINPAFITNRPSSTKDFHGDGVANSNVEIINTTSLGRDGIGKVIFDYVEDQRLPLGQSIKLSFLRFCSKFLFFNRNRSSSNSGVRILCKFSNLLRSGYGHSRILLFAFIAKCAKFIFKKSDNRADTTIKPEMSRYPICAYAKRVSIINIINIFFRKFNNFILFCADIVMLKKPRNYAEVNAEQLPYLFNPHIVNGSEFDNVVYVRLREVDSTCHVYNLENKNNWYVANGIITHNCRSTTTAVLIDKYSKLSEGRTRAARDPETGKVSPVSAKMTYYDWLKTQSEEFQDSVVGKTRGKLLRDGGISSQRFSELSLGKNFRPLNLSEMRELEPIAFMKAGL